jgi:3-carboxy-cis,cis-muconate cycloisomerase
LNDDPFAHLVARGGVVELTTTTAWLQAMLDVEAALATAQAAIGDIPVSAAAAIAEAARAECFDSNAIGAMTEQSGVAVIAIVEQLRSAVGADTAVFVHRGATSQDIVDTAAMVIAGRCSTHAAARLDEAGVRVDALAATHGEAPMIARTLGQYALPTTFATVSARWRAGIKEATTALRQGAATLPVQLGGPVADGASYGPSHPRLITEVAGRLGLAVPERSWSTMRTPIARLAGAWAVAGTVAGEIATQLVALMGSDVGELTERAPGAGGSSSMAHKQNPVAAISARAAAMQIPGLIATLLHAAGSHDFERASGAWHAEWPALNTLLRSGGSAIDWLATSLERVVVDTERMAENVAVAEAQRGGRD